MMLLRRNPYVHSILVTEVHFTIILPKCETLLQLCDLLFLMHLTVMAYSDFGRNLHPAVIIGVSDAGYDIQFVNYRLIRVHLSRVDLKSVRSDEVQLFDSIKTHDYFADTTSTDTLKFSNNDDLLLANFKCRNTNGGDSHAHINTAEKDNEHNIYARKYINRGVRIATKHRVL